MKQVILKPLLLVQNIAICDVKKILALFLIYQGEKEEIIETQKQKGSTSAMDELIDIIDGSAKDKKWSIFFEIIDKQGIA